jgi:hypothetical protein
MAEKVIKEKKQNIVGVKPIACKDGQRNKRSPSKTKHKPFNNRSQYKNLWSNKSAVRRKKKGISDSMEKNDSSKSPPAEAISKQIRI